MMKKVILVGLVLFFLSLIVFSFISNRGYNPSYYYSWHNSRDCKVSKWQNTSSFIFNAAYRPKEFMALSELNGEKFEKNKFNEVLKNYECCEHLLLKIFAKDTFSEALSFQINGEADYYDRIRYLNTEFGSKTYLIDGIDTLQCTFSLYERTYKLQPYIGVNLIYEKKNIKEQNPMTLIIEPTIFNKEYLKFDFQNGDLNQIPKLKI